MNPPLSGSSTVRTLTRWSSCNLLEQWWFSRLAFKLSPRPKHLIGVHVQASRVFEPVSKPINVVVALDIETETRRRQIRALGITGRVRTLNSRMAIGEPEILWRRVRVAAWTAACCHSNRVLCALECSRQATVDSHILIYRCRCATCTMATKPGCRSLRV